MKIPDKIFSGDKSADMWKSINEAKTKEDLRHAIYFVCCRLQMLEAKIDQDKVGFTVDQARAVVRVPGISPYYEEIKQACNKIIELDDELQRQYEKNKSLRDSLSNEISAGIDKTREIEALSLELNKQKAMTAALGKNPHAIHDFEDMGGYLECKYCHKKERKEDIHD